MLKDLYDEEYMEVIELLDNAYAYCSKKDNKHICEHVKNELDAMWHSAVAAYVTMLDFRKFASLRNERLCNIIDNLQDKKLVEMLCDVWMLFNPRWIEYMKNEESEA